MKPGPPPPEALAALQMSGKLDLILAIEMEWRWDPGLTCKQNFEGVWSQEKKSKYCPGPELRAGCAY